MALLLVAPNELAQAANGELWLGVSHSDPMYGGCVVWVSYDDVSYKNLALINTNAIQGGVVAAFNASSTVLRVNVGMSRAILEGVSELEKDSGGSLCRVGNELLSFQDVTLTSVSTYQLSGLKRGLYGTSKGASLRALFTICDSRLLKLPINPAWNGNTMFFKFQSFNVFRKGLQDLSGLPSHSVDIPLVTAKKSAAYIHYQSNPAVLWTIDHLLGRPVSVTTYENDGDKINGKNIHVGGDQHNVRFSQPFSGYAIVN